MSEKIEHKLTKEQIAIIERIVNSGQRAEIIPVKDGVKVVRVKRETIGVTAEKR